MITKLAILEEDDGKTFKIIEPTTNTLIQTCCEYAFARWFVEGFLDCMTAYTERKRPNLIAISNTQYQLAYHMGMLAASNLCEDWINQKKTFKFFGEVYV